MKRRLPAVLKQRPFRLLFAGQAVSLVGDGMVNVALAFAVLDLGGDATAVGTVFAVRMAPLVACLLAGGVVADRLPRRAVMLVADLVRFASQGLLAALLIFGVAEIWTVAVLSGVTGAASGFFNPAISGLAAAVVAPGDLQEANGLRAIARAVGEIGGPVIAGVLVAVVGSGWALGIDALTFAVSAYFLWRLPVPAAAERVKQSFWIDLREGWSAFSGRTWVWSFVLAACLGNVLWAAWSVLGPVIAEQDLGGASAWA